MKKYFDKNAAAVFPVSGFDKVQTVRLNGKIGLYVGGASGIVKNRVRHVCP